MDTISPAAPPRASRSTVIAMWLLVPLSILFVGLLATFFVNYSTAYVDGISMEPTLMPGELVLVTRGYDQPLRGDVVVVDVRLPGEPADVLVKRIVGLPGDEVEVDEGNAIINGESEKGDHTVYVASSDLSLPRQKVPEGHVLLLGDNRPVSEDSRLFGMVPIENVRGSVVAVLQPLDDARRVD